MKNLRELVDSKLLDANNGAGTALWCKLVPKKVNVFIWRLCKGGIPVKEVLYERGIDLDSRLCPKCNSDVESIKHCFLDCLISVRIWDKVSNWCGRNFQSNRSIEEMISDYRGNNGGSPLGSAREAVLSGRPSTFCGEFVTLCSLKGVPGSILGSCSSKFNRLPFFGSLTDLRVGGLLGWSD